MAVAPSMGGKQVTGPLLLSNEIRKDHGYGDRERERGEEREKKRAAGRALVGVTFPSGLSRGNVIPARGLLQAALDRGLHACPDSQDNLGRASLVFCVLKILPGGSPKARFR